MMGDGKMHGIVYAYDTDDEYAAVREIGLEWLRMPIAFPWTDRMFGTLSKRYLDDKAEMAKAKRNGMKVLCATPTVGGYVFVKAEGRTRWVDEWPEFVGEKETEAFRDNVRAVGRFYAEDLKDLIDDAWQIGNEMDIETFRGDYSLEVARDVACETAAGVREVVPGALCGINLAVISDTSMKLMDLCYGKGSPLNYVGIDGYAGSWQPGDVTAWFGIVDTLYTRGGIPVLVNEWGYSSNGKHTEPIPESECVKGWSTVCQTFGWHNECPGGHTPEVQAKYIERGLNIFSEHPHVIGNFIFCWKDAKHCYHCGQEGCPAECAWGIVENDKSPKPAYYVVRKALTGK